MTRQCRVVSSRQLGNELSAHLEELHYMMTLRLIVRVTRVAATASTGAQLVGLVFIAGQRLEV